MLGERRALVGCIVVLLLAGGRCLADSGPSKSTTASKHDLGDWRKSPPRGTHQANTAADVFEGSGAHRPTDVDDTATGFGPDDEDSEMGSGSPVDDDDEMVQSSGDHEEQPIDYDDYPKTDWIEVEDTTVHLATGAADFTTHTVPTADVDWHTTNVDDVWSEVPEEHNVPMGKTPTENIWPTMTMVPIEQPFTPAVVITTTTVISGTAATTDVPEMTNIFGSRNHGGRFDSLWKPGILAAIIGGSVLGLLAAVMLITFVVYRMRKKDEGSYALDESKTPPAYPYAYHKAPTREFYA